MILWSRRVTANSTCPVPFYLNVRLFHKTNGIILYSKIYIYFLNLCLCGDYNRAFLEDVGVKTVIVGILNP